MKKIIVVVSFLLLSVYANAQTAGQLVAEAQIALKANPNSLQARQLYQDALVLDPTNELALFGLASHNIQVGNYLEARENLSLLIENYPDNANYYWQRVRVLVRPKALNKDLELATQDLEKAINLGFNYPQKVTKARAKIKEYSR